jgi:hypothetical protein
LVKLEAQDHLELLGHRVTKDRKVTTEVLDQAAPQDLLGRLDRLDLEARPALLAVLVHQALQALSDRQAPPVLKDNWVLQVRGATLDHQEMQDSKVHWVQRDLLEHLERQEIKEQPDCLVPLVRLVQLDH